MIEQETFLRVAIVLLAVIGLLAVMGASRHAAEFGLKFKSVWLRHHHRLLGAAFVLILCSAGVIPGKEDHEATLPDETKETLRFLSTRTADMQYEIRELTKADTK